MSNQKGNAGSVKSVSDLKEGDRINRDNVTSKVLRPNLLSNTVDDS